LAEFLSIVAKVRGSPTSDKVGEKVGELGNELSFKGTPALAVLLTCVCELSDVDGARSGRSIYRENGCESRSRLICGGCASDPKWGIGIVGPLYVGKWMASLENIGLGYCFRIISPLITFGGSELLAFVINTASFRTMCLVSLPLS
jgi:hypothetical protein